MFAITQWTYEPLGASGSSTTMANACVAEGCGTPDQCSGRVLPVPPGYEAHPNRVGIRAPSRNAALVTVNHSPRSAALLGFGASPQAVSPPPATRARARPRAM